MLGVTVRTIQRWDKEGKIKCVRTVGGKRRVPESEIKRILGIQEKRKIIGYARVSSRTQKEDLERQIELIKSCAKSPRCGLIINRQSNASINLYLGTWGYPERGETDDMLPMSLEGLRLMCPKADVRSSMRTSAEPLERNNTNLRKL